MTSTEPASDTINKASNPHLMKYVIENMRLIVGCWFFHAHKLTLTATLHRKPQGAPFLYFRQQPLKIPKILHEGAVQPQHDIAGLQGDAADVGSIELHQT